MTDPIAKLLGEWSQTLNGASVLFRILLSVCLSAMIGCERSSKRHSAGLRTFILVSLATTVTMLLDQYLAAAAAMEFFCAFQRGDRRHRHHQRPLPFRQLPQAQIRGLTTAAGTLDLRHPRTCRRSRLLHGDALRLRRIAVLPCLSPGSGTLSQEPLQPF